MTLDAEPREFHKYHETQGDVDSFLQLPSEEFSVIVDDIEYLFGFISGPLSRVLSTVVLSPVSLC